MSINEDGSAKSIGKVKITVEFTVSNLGYYIDIQNFGFDNLLEYVQNMANEEGLFGIVDDPVDGSWGDLIVSAVDLENP